MQLSDGCRVLPYLGVKPDSTASTHSLVFVISFLIGGYLLYNLGLFLPYVNMNRS